MKLIFKQQPFAWLDSYDIFNENEEVIYTVKGQPSFGHCLQICDNQDKEVAMIKEKVMSLLPKYEVTINNEIVGSISKKFSLLKPKFTFDYNNWQVIGDILQTKYTITDNSGSTVATMSKELFKLTDTYVIELDNEKDALYVLMFALAIDAAKSDGKNSKQR